MTHFACYVVLPLDYDKNDIEKEVDKLLAPFDENMEFPEYETECYCVGSVAMSESREQTDTEIGTIEHFKASFVSSVNWFGDTPPTDEEIASENLRWQEHIKPRQDFYDAFLAEHPLVNAASQFCEDCKGTGTRVTTYNPQAKWDWWQIGGRFSGPFDGKDTCLAQELPTGWSCWALVTPGKYGGETEWHEKGQMGWWGMSTGDRKDWKEYAYEVMSAFPDHLVVNCDLHI